MEAKELRIGNRVTAWSPEYKDNPHQWSDEHVVSADTIQQLERGTIGMKPIPLTEEWLLRFGFTQGMIYRSGGSYKAWINFSFYLDINHQDDFFYNWMGGNVQVEFVHQLQNLYFALTGKELEIK